MVEAQAQRFAFVLEIDFLELFRQANDRNALQAQFLQLFARGAQLPFAPSHKIKSGSIGDSGEDGRPACGGSTTGKQRREADGRTTRANGTWTECYSWPPC